MKFIHLLIFSLVFPLLWPHVAAQNTQSTPEARRIDSLRALIHAHRNDSTAVAAKLSLATLAYEQQPDSGMYYAQSALAEAIRLHQKALEAEAHKILGMVAIKRSEYNTAIGHTETAIKIYQEFSDIVNQGQCFNNLGITYYRMSDYLNAAKNFIKALNVAEVLDDKPGMARMYNNIAGIRMVQGEFEEAANQYRGAMRIYQTEENPKNLATVYNNLGKAFEKMDRADSSIRYYLLALDLRRRMNDEEGLANCYATISVLFERREDYVRALDNAHKALEIFESRSDRSRVAELTFQVGKLRLVQQQYDLAKTSLEAALVLATEHHLLGLEGRVYLQLSYLYKELGDKKMANEYEQKYEKILKNINNSVKE